MYPLKPSYLLFPNTLQAEVQKNHVKPGNVWTQRQTLPGAPGPTPPAKSAWAANGQNGLASRVGSMQDAWAKK